MAGLGVGAAALGGLAVPASAAGKASAVPHYLCSSTTEFVDTGQNVVVRDPIGKTFNQYNSSSSKHTYTVSESTSTSVGTDWTITGNGSGSVDLKIVTIGVGGSAGRTTTKSIQVTQGDSTDQVVPGHEWGLARFGPQVIVTTGYQYSLNKACKEYNVIHFSKVTVPVANSDGWQLVEDKSDTW